MKMSDLFVNDWVFSDEVRCMGRQLNSSRSVSFQQRLKGADVGGQKVYRYRH